MKQIISLSIVSIAFDTAEMRRMNRALDLMFLSLEILDSITNENWNIQDSPTRLQNAPLISILHSEIMDSLLLKYWQIRNVCLIAGER